MVIPLRRRNRRVVRKEEKDFYYEPKRERSGRGEYVSPTEGVGCCGWLEWCGGGWWLGGGSWLAGVGSWLVRGVGAGGGSRGGRGVVGGVADGGLVDWVRPVSRIE